MEDQVYGTYPFAGEHRPIRRDSRGFYIAIAYDDEFTKKIGVAECHICDAWVLDGDDVQVHGVSICDPCATAIMNLKHHKHSGEYITWDNPQTETERRSARRKITPSKRRRVHERDYYACRYCGARQNLEIDHVQPVTKDGDNDEDNLVTACHDCNQRKFNRTPDEAGMTLHPPEAFA